MMIDIVPKFYSAKPQPLPEGLGQLRIFNVKVFVKSAYFPNYMTDFVHIWYNDRFSSKVLFSNTLPMPVTSRSRSQI